MQDKGGGEDSDGARLGVPCGKRDSRGALRGRKAKSADGGGGGNRVVLKGRCEEIKALENSAAMSRSRTVEARTVV